MRFIIALLTGLTLSFAVTADTAVEPITLKEIMGDPDWMGTPPRDAYWSEDGQTVYYTKKRLSERGDDLWQLSLADNESRVVMTDSLPQHGTADGAYNEDRTLKAFVRQGDLYIQAIPEGTVRQLTRTAAGYSNPRFLLDGRIAVRSGNQFHAYDLESGVLERLAEIRFESDPDARPLSSGYMAEQNRRLLTVLAERQERTRIDRERRASDIDRDPGRPARPFFLGDGRMLATAEISPDGRWLLVATAQTPRNGPRRDTVPFFVTDDGYVDNRPVRPKVGEGEPGTHQFMMLDLASGQRMDLDLSPLPGIKEDPLRRMREARNQPMVQGNRAVTSMGARWSGDAARVALMVRTVDNKDRWIAVIESSDLKVTPHHRLTDPAWVNWSGWREFFNFNEFGWLNDHTTLWYLSEETGYSHLYLHGPRDRRPRALTRGNFEVSHPTLTRDGMHFYFTANAEHPGIHEVYRVAVAGGASERITHLNGRTRFALSPDESSLLLTSSSRSRNDELFVQDIAPGAVAQQLTQSMSERFLSYPWAEGEVIAVPSTGIRGRFVYSNVYVPHDFDPQRAEPYPVVMFAHGAGYLQNVHYGFSSYFREFMFHTYLVERGYVVIDMDFRASAGYGRDWRTAIYRDMGRPELQDFKDGIAWMARERNADPDRAGIYGGSYGGFLAFMGLFLEPDMFKAGAALRPVSDWVHYNHGYTANILNTPEVDPEAYERSSPIEYAEGLRNQLLILAPMVDTNVLFKDVVRLVQRLIELEKTEYFETAIYPVEDHGFIEPSSWLDEYRRIFMLFERTLR